MLGSHDIMFITIDTLRHDVAADALRAGMTPALAAILPGGAWEKRHSPSSFTYAAHQAFFAGFLPTPVTPVRQDPAAHERLFAARFAGSETTSARTLAFDAPDIVTGFAMNGYHTICIGGTGFFNKQTPLGSVLPGLFSESWWDESLGVADPASPANQADRAIASMAARPAGERLFTFVNVAACHQPNCIYLPGATHDTPASQAAALAAFDRELPRLLATAQARAPVLLVICSDHGEAYGEDGYHGHRLGHAVVWDVPYAQAVLPFRGGGA
nr:STM4013/SEN3800 family hydrolase [Sphingomonas colocasiae]